MAEFKIKLIKSHIGKPPKQKAVLNGMGLNKLNKIVVLQDTPEIRGMIRKVSHLVKIEE
ncbi:50S ribosomal protein L30 [Geobacter sp. DSM 9736]|uniref:50S ribosomal protein L30 n=1 Tax=Geobacter sp. DSM 9736 TaxID=1277350 RepID=UPI000B506912|nr:50S ribosomal protein L30 [Geobacter sp. DSM 9736]SNB46456.1 LSU ribosomal protein L30P [Geobacter sp. DSM 9736]